MKRIQRISTVYPLAVLVGAMIIAQPAPAADVTGDDMQGEIESSDTRGTPPSASSQDIANKYVADLKGMPLNSMESEEIGEVAAVARDKADDSTVAVISVGGFFGIGDTRVTIPVDTLDLVGDHLVTSAAQTEDELIRQGQKYLPERYSELGDRERLAEYLNPASGKPARTDTAAAPPAAPVEGSTSLHARFQALDADGSGAIDTNEAQADKRLSDSWERVDSDGNGAVDTVEFSAFETRDTAPESGPYPGDGSTGHREQDGSTKP